LAIAGSSSFIETRELARMRSKMAGEKT